MPGIGSCWLIGMFAGGMPEFYSPSPPGELPGMILIPALLIIAGIMRLLIAKR